MVKGIYHYFTKSEWVLQYTDSRKAGGKMKKKLLLLAMVISMVALGVTGYYIRIIWQTGKYTKEVIMPDLVAETWRAPGGEPRPLRLGINDLSERQIEILLAVQDPGFYDHNGIDLLTPGAGLTTITQALVKKLYFAEFTPGIKKIEQTLIATVVLEPWLSKDDQLSLFLNTMYFGNVNGRVAIGFADAAEIYYDKSFAELTEDEYISLVAMLVAPNTFNPYTHPEWNEERVRRIKLLVNGGYQPRGLLDQYYGSLPPETIRAGLPPCSYFDFES